MISITIEDVLRSDGKRVVETTAGRYVYHERDDGNYEWDRHASEHVERFPSDAVETAVEETIEGTVADVFPLLFTVYSNDAKNTDELLKSACLPTEDGELANLLYYYPGEIEITYELQRIEGRYDLNPIAMQYEGKIFTPGE